MQQMTKPAPLAGWQAGQGSGRGTMAVASGHQHFTPCVIVVHKRGRNLAIAKLVEATPLGEMVLAMPYRNRQTVDYVSIPPVVLRYAREHGARLWLVRLDGDGLCYSLPLADVERVGWLKLSDGQAEWFVPLSRFTAIPWQDWAYITDVMRLREPEPAASRQMALW